MEIAKQPEAPVNSLRQIFQRVETERQKDLQRLGNVASYSLDQLTEERLSRLTLEERIKVILQNAQRSDVDKTRIFATDDRFKRILCDLTDPSNHGEDASMTDIKRKLDEYHLGDILTVMGINSLTTYKNTPISQDERSSRHTDYGGYYGATRKRAVFFAVGQSLKLGEDLEAFLLDPSFAEVVQKEYGLWFSEELLNALVTLNIAVNPNLGQHYIADLLHRDYLRYAAILDKPLYAFSGGRYGCSVFYEDHPDGAWAAKLFDRFGIYVPDIVDVFERLKIREDLTVILDVCEKAVAEQPAEEAKSYMTQAWDLIRAGHIAPPELQRYKFMKLIADLDLVHMARYLNQSWPQQTMGIFEIVEGRSISDPQVIIHRDRLETRIADAQRREEETARITDLMAGKDTKGELESTLHELIKAGEIKQLAGELEKLVAATTRPDVEIVRLDMEKHRDHVVQEMSELDKINQAYMNALVADLEIPEGRLRQNVSDAKLLPETSLSVEDVLALGEQLIDLYSKGELPFTSLYLLTDVDVRKSYFDLFEGRELLEEQKAQLSEHQRQTALFLENYMQPWIGKLSKLQTTINNLKAGNLEKSDEKLLAMLIGAMAKVRHLQLTESGDIKFQGLVDNRLLSSTYTARDGYTADMVDIFHPGGKYGTLLHADRVLARPIDSVHIERKGKKGNVFLVSAPAGAGKSSFVRAMANCLNLTYIGDLGTVQKMELPKNSDGNPPHALTPGEAKSDYIASTFGSGVERLAVKLTELFNRPPTDHVVINLDEILVGTITPERVRLASALILAFGELFPNVTWMVISHDTQRYFRIMKLLEIIGGDNFPCVQTFAIHPETHQPIPDTIADGMGIHVAHREGLPEPIVVIARILEESVEDIHRLNTIEVGDLQASAEEVEVTDESFITECEAEMLGFKKDDLDSGVFGTAREMIQRYLRDITITMGRWDAAENIARYYANKAVGLLTLGKTADISRFHQAFRRFRDMDKEAYSQEIVEAGKITLQVNSELLGLDNISNIVSFVNNLKALDLEAVAADISKRAGLTREETEEILAAGEEFNASKGKSIAKFEEICRDRAITALAITINPDKIKSAIESGDMKERELAERIKKGESLNEIFDWYLKSDNLDMCTSLLVNGCDFDDPRISSLFDVNRHSLETEEREQVRRKLRELFPQDLEPEKRIAAYASLIKTSGLHIDDILDASQKKAYDTFHRYWDMYFFAIGQAAVSRTDNGFGVNWCEVQKNKKGGYPVVGLKNGYDIGLYGHFVRDEEGEKYIPRNNELPEEIKATNILAYRGSNMVGKTQGMITDMHMFVWDRLTGGLVPAEEAILEDIDALQVSVNTARATGRFSTFMAEVRDKASKARKALYFSSMGKRIFAAIDEPFSGIGEIDKSILTAAFAIIYKDHALAFTNHDPLLNLLLNVARIGGRFDDRGEFIPGDPLAWNIATVIPGYKIGEYGKTDLVGSYSEAPDVFRRIFIKAGYPDEFVDHMLQIATRLRKLDELCDEKQKQLGY